MTGELVSPETFRWILTGLTIAGSVWVLYDVYRLVKLRRADPRDPVVRDKRFGYVIGILIGVLAVVGVLRFHDVL
jgi:hypothetical protein